ncbi:MAG: Gfo/Idh/MocA family oxidoreductase [Victivallaceae bacterium]|nr:Gfo/Idh/MocA family oxidoreductase [Victivallaceae bacterium]MDD4316949.1 Gfo/Idh/MocA family oxidoreductase [Victivallaceae bacterium]
MQKKSAKKKYVLVGTGSRASMYVNALMRDYTDVGELSAFCDSNQARMDYWNSVVTEEYKKKALPTFMADEFERMINKIKPDKVIVTTMDRTHHTYICKAMELGCDVITEKPLTVDAEKCQQIIDTSKRTGKNVTVTFNYRYSPRNTKIKEVINSGVLGDLTSIHFEWLLSTVHGADYFRRWHRNKNNSGGLMVHKATHHFDLVNWWTGSFPETVFAMGDLFFYGKENAEKRGVREFYYRAKGSKIAAKDPFALHVTAKDERLKGLYFDKAEKEDHYFRDQSVFGDGISIEDNMGVMVRYRNKAIMTYSLNAHSPWEGYRVCFNGTKGRLEFNVVETPYVSGGYADFNQPGMHELDCDKETMVPEIIFQPHWGKPQVIDYEKAAGGHGGGDKRLLDHLFRGAKVDPLGHAAGCEDGAKSILIGIAANKSMKTGLPVEIKTLVNF